MVKGRCREKGFLLLYPPISGWVTRRRRRRRTRRGSEYEWCKKQASLGS